MDYYRLSIPIPTKPWLWIRFRIVTILLLIAIVAISLSWRRDHRELAQVIHQLQNPSAGWGVDQLAGAPNTTGPGDIRTAWASATPDDQAEWIVVEYDSKVVPAAIVVHETCNPGAVVKATHFPQWGKEQILWEGTDPTPVAAGAGISRLPVQTDLTTNRIKLYIDSLTVPGWNEIDAVGLETSDGKIIWATGASASTNYGSNYYQGAGNLVY